MKNGFVPQQGLQSKTRPEVSPLRCREIEILAAPAKADMIEIADRFSKLRRWKECLPITDAFANR